MGKAALAIGTVATAAATAAAAFSVKYKPAENNNRKIPVPNIQRHRKTVVNFPIKKSAKIKQTLVNKHSKKKQLLNPRKKWNSIPVTRATNNRKKGVF